VSHLKFSGLGMLQKQISSVIADARSLIDHDEAKMVLRTLQDPVTTAVNPTAVMKIKTAGMVFMGLVKDVWENLVEKDESKKGGALIHLLTVEFGDNWLVRLKDKVC